ncbi:MAG TPA: hypothetical protein VGX00_02070 [Thermoplasmata archaeon]|nr:hypothetical protein [Thermoplasmata archaeon]
MLVGVVIVIVVIVVVAGLYIGYPSLFGKKSASSPEAGGFAGGQVVHFTYTGQSECKPDLSTLVASAPASASTYTQCGVIAANVNSVESTQLPEWVLVPAFAGLSIFGVTALGGSSAGFPQFQGAAIATDCGAGGSPTGCADHPKYIYSPLFAAVETYLNLTNGYNGLPLGVLPTPAHDHLINTTSTWPNIPWGTIVVLVLDPDIWPDRATAQCTASVASNLSSPTANCLTSLTALDRALSTSSHSVVTAGASSDNKIWKALGGPSAQVIVPGDMTIPQVNNNLNSNLYIWFPVAPGAPDVGFPSLTATSASSGYGG